ncbi:MAG TPA: NADH-quinone oxidoreductase subunit NuoK [Candidatus Omnitrophota bacterium]|jgi:NADH-quinone oxidoreductase subunit K|nr:MAG: NADH-quinone oxidoreductase subunit K [Candidatus Omnitrophica bacterium ADurb.Bin314]HOE68174.1 NADH-quinone oxidoreductase subunit NuoK [Candidatus Omnitrophota bacterium]HPW65193.1 NADH-quinone oxidoreductase subunit NuoK [Candidatus Omnitrophota bacterium]HQB93967.1 NADH-quinone oxidoreductase subunit NuoK [Candidatus Omnitrophota bacterium]
MIIPLPHVLLFSLALFGIGAYGVLTRRNIIGILISIELMLNAAGINLIAFSKTTALAPETGQIFAVFVIAIAAMTATVGLAIVLALYRARKTVFADEVNLLKW